VIGVAHSVLSLAEAVLPVANRNVVTDVAAATEAARAAATTARLNVEVNLRGVPDNEVRARLAGVLDLVEPLAARAAAVESAVREMVG
jgi:methenyltetrahydrofolate cyclohydrolase